MDLILRPESSADAEAIRDVHRLAFGQDDEALIVDGLRNGGFVRISIVAQLADQVVGHILFGDLAIQTPSGRVDALALAPLAVVPQRQRQGIGSALVREGLRACGEHNHRIVVVLGHPEFYPRFGFSAELARPLKAPFSGPAFMAVELVAGALEGVEGDVLYPAPFGLTAG